MATPLLNDDGSASIATLLMSSHHAFRRDLACFAAALASGAVSAAVRDEWARFREHLHGHHVAEDTGIFPELRAQRPELAAQIDALDADHRAIDPLLARGDRAFAALDGAAARLVIADVRELLAGHLDREERTISGFLRGAKVFPPPPDDAALALYADGFAWSCAGIAPDVLDRIFAMLPAELVARLPAARAAFDDRCRRVWGRAHAGASVTSVP